MRSRRSLGSFSLAVSIVATSALVASRAPAEEPETEPEPLPPPSSTPSDPEPPISAPPSVEPAAPASELESLAPKEAEEERMSEGRMLVSAYHSGFQWGISPGVVFSSGKAGFFLGVRLGYGIDTGPVIVVPGVRVAAYFTDPNVYVGMPTFKLVLPIDRFAPFVEGGGGVGHVTDPSKSGFAWMGGGGFMIHFTRVALGAEASYQAITGTDFSGVSVGPILALGF